MGSFQHSPWRNLCYTLWFPVYFLLYLVIERLIPSAAWTTQLPLDGYIPFCEWFVIPYCLWYPLLVVVGIYLLLRDPGTFRRYMCFLAWSFFLSELIWFLFPNGQNLRPSVMPRDNLLTSLISLIYSADTNTNVFPSVHVVGSLGAMLAVWDCWGLREKHPGICWATSLLGVLICLSTLFIKQHAALDVISGILLSLIVAIPVYHSSPAFCFFPRPKKV